MLNTIIYIIIYLLFACIFLIKVRPKPCKLSADSFFVRINSLRGIFALEIVLGHCVRYEHCLLTPLGNFMLVSVGFFFFASGFGLSRSYHSKPNYMESFLRNRILHLCIIALLGLIFTTVIALIFPVKTDFAVMPTSFSSFLGAILYRTNWYIRELLILYFLFFLSYRYGSNSISKIYRLLFLILSIVVVCVFLYSFNYTRCWFSSIICFPLGIAFYDYYDKFISLLLSLKGKIIATLILLCGLSLSIINYPGITGLPFEKTEMLYALSNSIMCFGFILILSTFIMYFRTGNVLLDFLTKHSTEIYLFQFVILETAEQMGLPIVPKIVFVVFLDILVATMLHPLFKRIK